MSNAFEKVMIDNTLYYNVNYGENKEYEKKVIDDFHNSGGRHAIINRDNKQFLQIVSNNREIEMEIEKGEMLITSMINNHEATFLVTGKHVEAVAECIRNGDYKINGEYYGDNCMAIITKYGSNYINQIKYIPRNNTWIFSRNGVTVKFIVISNNPNETRKQWIIMDNFNKGKGSFTTENGDVIIIVDNDTIKGIIISENKPNQQLLPTAITPPPENTTERKPVPTVSAPKRNNKNRRCAKVTNHQSTNHSRGFGFLATLSGRGDFNLYFLLMLAFFVTMAVIVALK
jgi:hypothetical protein